MTKIEKINAEIEKNNQKIEEIQKKARASIAEIQKKNKFLENQLTEEENLTIVKMVKTVNLDNKQLTAFLKAYAKGDIEIPKEYLNDTDELEETKNEE